MLAHLAAVVVDGAQTIAIIYVALLLRASATTLGRDLRMLMAEVAASKVRLEEIEFRLGIDRESGESGDASRRPRP
jgi:hypothetical protein